MLVGVGIGIGQSSVIAAPSGGGGPTYGPDISTSAGGGNWTGSGWTENAGANTLTAFSSGTITNVAAPTAEAGATYRIEWELVSVGGGLSLGNGPAIGNTTALELRMVPGVYADEVTAASTGRPQFFCGDEDGCVIGAWSFRKILS